MENIAEIKLLQGDHRCLRFQIVGPDRKLTNCTVFGDLTVFGPASNAHAFTPMQKTAIQAGVQEALLNTCSNQKINERMRWLQNWLFS